MAEPARNYRDDIAETFIARIEAGTAPWQQPWKAGIIGQAPFNPITGKTYRGINDLWLTLQGHTDPRWMTYKQATTIGAQVRKGEKAASIEYWQWSERKALLDAQGKPELDDKGQPKIVDVVLERPKVFIAKVFNGSQIDGLQPWAPAPSVEVPQLIDRAEKIIAGTGITINHDQRHNRAFYRPSTDQIHLPPLAAFKDQVAYYETALHEIGHATGHESRLARSFGALGTNAYAREELRAEIASYMLARDMGISHDPSNHASYVESWVQNLRDHKSEIFAAARDAEIVKTWVMEPDRRPELERAAQQRVVPVAPSAPQAMPAIQAEKGASPQSKEDGMAQKTRTYLSVPFGEKDDAKSQGARWDGKEKSWYITAGQDPALFQKWAGKPRTAEPSLSPQEEFGQFLKDHGLIVKGAPDMDGEWHRVPVDGDKGNGKSGSYRAFLDGRPSGTVTNWKAGIEGKRWVSTGQALTAEAKMTIQAEIDQNRQDREEKHLATIKDVAKKAYGVWANLGQDATPENSPYLAAKGVQGYGVKVTGDNKMVIPCRDENGRLWNVQFVDKDSKIFLKDGRKIGTFHVLEASGKGTLDALPKDGSPIIIGEGYATAATIREATNRPVISAFDSSNLVTVAQVVRDKFPDRPILIAADFDHANVNGNVGWNKAQEAATAVNGTAVHPNFSQAEKDRKLTDFNDLKQSRGAGAVRSTIENALSQFIGLDRSA